LVLFRAVYPIKTDAFGIVAMQDFDGVAVGDGDDGAGTADAVATGATVVSMANGVTSPLAIGSF
jgi:hypothetical protein